MSHNAIWGIVLISGLSLLAVSGQKQMQATPRRPPAQPIIVDHSKELADLRSKFQDFEDSNAAMFERLSALETKQIQPAPVQPSVAQPVAPIHKALDFGSDIRTLKLPKYVPISIPAMPTKQQPGGHWEPYGVLGRQRIWVPDNQQSTSYVSMGGCASGSCGPRGRRR